MKIEHELFLCWSDKKCHTRPCLKTVLFCSEPNQSCMTNLRSILGPVVLYLTTVFPHKNVCCYMSFDVLWKENVVEKYFWRLFFARACAFSLFFPWFAVTRRPGRFPLGHRRSRSGRFGHGDYWLFVVFCCKNMLKYSVKLCY